MRCLVTGASGHLGSYLTRLLLRHGEEVAILVRPSSNLWRLDDVLPKVRMLYGDLDGIDRAVGDIQDFGAETIFHLAWDGVTRDTRNCPGRIVSNVSGSLRLFRMAQAAGLRSWVGVGSQAEYGPQQVPLREDLTPAPNSAYGVAKRCLGELLEALCASLGVRYVWFRLLATFGPKDDVRHFVPSIIEDLLAGSSPSMTSGLQRWDYLYVEDAAEALYRASVMPEVNGVYNLASGQPMSIREIAERIRDLIDSSRTIEFGAAPLNSDAPSHLEADITRFQSDCGWRPRTSLEKGLEMTVSWHLAQRKAMD